VKARVARIEGFSAHADRDELLRWATCLKTVPRQAFVVHGEPQVAEHFRSTLEQKMQWSAMVPSPGQSVELDGMLST
jgi:metallo-beta-lactamase family protein